MGHVVVITGPTATGKSRLALALAERLNGEIINADAMQVYRGMDIGTAKPSREDRARVPHHLFDIVDVTERFSAGKYVAMALPVIRDILDRGRVPIVVGGTGLYVRALTRGLFKEAERDDTVEASLDVTLARVGPEYLYRMLQHVDPTLAAGISPRDRQRILRGLSFYFATGSRLSEQWGNETPPIPSDQFIMVGLTAPREKLYEAINRRVDDMVAAGLLAETESLLAAAGTDALHAFKAIGYKEMIGVIRGTLTREEAAALIKRNTRRFAKRQLTWFRQENCTWFDVDPLAGEIPVEEIHRFITMKGTNQNGE